MYNSIDSSVRRPRALTTLLIASSLVALTTVAQTANAQVVALQNATATFSQTNPVNFSGSFSVAQAINGNTAQTDRGWAIYDGDSAAADKTNQQTAAFQTVTNAGIAGGTKLTFGMVQIYGTQHLIGHFRFSYTTDNRSTFADGLANGGNVTANWTVLSPTSVLSANGATLSVLGDNSILSGGTLPNTDTYTVTANTNVTGITGFRLEVLNDASLPTTGPGRMPSNGNFVLSQLTVSQAPSAAPEASPLALAVLGGLVGFVAHRRKVA